MFSSFSWPVVIDWSRRCCRPHPSQSVIHRRRRASTMDVGCIAKQRRRQKERSPQKKSKRNQSQLLVFFLNPGCCFIVSTRQRAFSRYSSTNTNTHYTHTHTHTYTSPVRSCDVSTVFRMAIANGAPLGVKVPNDMLSSHEIRQHWILSLLCFVCCFCF